MRPEAEPVAQVQRPAAARPHTWTNMRNQLLCDGLPAITNGPSKGHPGVYNPTSSGFSRSSRRTTITWGAGLCFVAALALPLTAASLPDFRSHPPCDCEGAVLLERQQLQAEHARSVTALVQTYERQIRQLERLVAARGGDTAARSRPLPRAALAPDTPTGPIGGVQPTGAVARLGELAKSAPSRALLQTEKFCSMDELMSVQKDAAAAVTGMLTTNVGCAMCLIPCASAENAIGCAIACVKQVPDNCNQSMRAHKA
jgi:hypothetical protein